MNGDGEDPELGEPIAQLANLGMESSPGFMHRVRRRIERRRLGSHIAGFAWGGLAEVLLELVAMLTSLLAGSSPSDRDER